MLDEPIPLRASQFRVRSDDPTFQVAWRGGGRFELTGEVSSEPSAELQVETPSAEFEVELAQRSRPEHAVALLRRKLPRSVVMTDARTRDGVEFVLLEATVPAATPPRLRLLTTDLLQRTRQLADNKVELLGATGAPAQLTILCDNRRVTIMVGAGSSAQATAARVGAAMPHGYRALVDGPVVSVWKNADFFLMVA